MISLINAYVGFGLALAIGAQMAPENEKSVLATKVEDVMSHYSAVDANVKDMIGELFENIITPDVIKDALKIDSKKKKKKNKGKGKKDKGKQRKSRKKKKKAKQEKQK